jgi:hypothetical protein
LAHPSYDRLTFALSEFGHDLRYASRGQVARQGCHDALLYGFARTAAVAKFKLVQW